MAAGDAAMAVALADSVLFSLDADAARSRVLLFLAISFVPFLFVAPLIGPAIDRMRGGRRLVVQIVTVVRVVLSLLMAFNADSLLLFPLAFGALVAQKTYFISKSALVPSVVRTEEELVEANSKLGLISGLVGTVAVGPAALLQATLGAGATLRYSAVIFAFAFVAATKLPREAVAVRAADHAEQVELHSDRVVLGATAMVVARGAVGFTFFHLYFWFRHQDAGLVWFGVALALAGVVTMVGNAAAPRIRDHLREETMLSGALLLVAASGVVSAVLGGVAGALVLVATVNLGAAIARLAFESIVQRDAPDANRGRAFAQFETRFQLAWVAAGVAPVLFQMPGRLGFVVVALAALASVVFYLAGTRAVAAGRTPLHPVTAIRRARASRRPPARASQRPLPPPPPGARRGRGASRPGRTPGRSGSSPPPPPPARPRPRPTGRSEP